MTTASVSAPSAAPAMVERLLRARGVLDERVLSVMKEVPRHLFVPEAFRQRAYADNSLPIGEDQTISQPYIVGRMTEALLLIGSEKVLEIGTGSGYQTAVLAALARSVFSVERIHRLAIAARSRLEALGVHNVSVRAANGALGWAEFSPYDRILVTACAREVPKTLLDQLADGGRLVLPLGSQEEGQELMAIDKRHGKTVRTVLGSCSFVPFID